MKQGLFILVIFTCILSGSLFAQEICNNCIDDDNDGYLDCFDIECSNNAACDSFFYGHPSPDCQFLPSVPNFSLIEDWSASPASGHSPVFCGDLDNDGMPEVLVRYQPDFSSQGSGTPNGIRIFDGVTGTLKYSPNTMHVAYTNNGFVLADANRDGNGEFYYITADNTPGGNDKKIVCYEFNPGSNDFVFKWLANNRLQHNGYEVFFSVDIADFDGDGIPEVYSGNQIFNALTGVEIAGGGISNSVGWVGNSTHPSAFPVAADVLNASTLISGVPCGSPCDGLELIAGNQVYSVDITSGTMQVMMQASGGLPDGSTSVVDYDLDGDLDAVVAAQNINGQASLYVWDLQTPAQIGSVFPVSPIVIGRPTVGDFDSDGKPEVGVCGENIYTVMDDYQFPTALWTLSTNDPSGRTGATIFDFEGDGSAEIIYRDAEMLRILNGATGATLASIPCTSPTANEYPIVVDVDNDGEAEIVCTCGDADFGQVKTFKSNGSPWIPARSVWNQHAYFVVNINDDLTVPACQQLHHLEFPVTGSGKRPFNNFLAQTTMIDSLAEVAFPAADATITATPLNCGGDSIDVSMQVCNRGNNILPSNVSVIFYNSNPTHSNAIILHQFYTTSGIPVDSCRNFTARIKKSLEETIYLFVNDAGTSVLPFDCVADFPNTSIGECDFCNNMDSVTLISLLLQIDVSICKGDSFFAGGSYQRQSGVYHDTLIASGGCDSIVETELLVSDELIHSISNDDTIWLGDNIQLTATGGSFYSWAPAGSLSCADCPNPSASPLASTTYHVTITDNFNCSVTDSVRITVETKQCDERSISIASAFSPNSDNVNDFLPVHGNGDIVLEYLEIYNRWGEKIFRTENADQGWDGTYKGTICDLGVYVYLISAKCPDKQVLKSGNVTLVK